MIHIRTAVPADAPRLRTIHEASWRDAYARFVPPAAMGAPLDRVMARRWDVWPQDRTIFVAQSDEILGFAALIHGTAQGDLDNLHIDPRARGRKIGSALLRHSAAYVLAQGGARLHLEVLAGNAGARRFYRAHGGAEGPAKDDKLLGYPADYVAMTWSGKALHDLAQPEHTPA
ncbi:MAG: GNAT family N-acetyltransferase [Pseudomonadota bacterium]